MGLRFVEYRRRQWVLRYRDPWSGKQRIKSFSTEGEARQFESVQAEMHIRERGRIGPVAPRHRAPAPVWK